MITILCIYFITHYAASKVLIKNFWYYSILSSDLQVGDYSLCNIVTQLFRFGKGLGEDDRICR